MPEFIPGESRTAIAPITVKPSGLACEAELFLGPNDTTKVATSGKKAFTSTGTSQSVNLPVVMPPEGTYHVYIDVLVEGEVIAAYQATDDVVILPPTPVGFTLGVVNAPAPATQWGVYCNCETTLFPNSIYEQPTKSYGALPLLFKWVCVDPAPGLNPMDFMCLDANLSPVKEVFVTATIKDGKNYIFDFATDTLKEI